MNQTKKITTGAMLLAIVGAAMLLDRQFSYAFDVLISLVMPIIIIVYATKYTLADGALLCIGLSVICFLFEGITSTTFIYLPITIISGLGYSFGLKKNLNKNLLMYMSSIIYMIGEVLTTFLVMPIFGVDITSQVAAMSEVTKQLLTNSAVTINLTDNLVLLIFIVSMIITGVMEGFLIHILSCFLLKRFKIKEVESFDFFAKRPNPVVGYVSILCASVFFFVQNLQDQQILFVILTSIGMLGLLVLFYSGYMFTIFYGRTINKGKFNLIIIFAVILLFPTSALVLVILGFLYLTGPLRDVLERKIIKNEEQ